LKLARTKEWREAHGLTQRELAAEAGVGEVTVARVETGSSVAPPTARKIAKALDVSVADLLERPPVPLAEAPQESGHGSGPPQVSHEELAELGVTATDAELRQLNDTMASLWRLAVLGEKAHAFVGQDDVDTNRILILMHLVLGTPSIVTPEAAGVVNQGMKESLKAG
jgi:transcriptional regulator with XRE-family HTH domain